jgi:hypothetical protein
MSLHDQLIHYAALHPKPDTGEDSWEQMCGNLIFRAGEHTTPSWAPRVTGPNAWDVGLASGPRNTDHTTAPVGAFHWWRNRNTTGMPGHVGVDTYGGGHTVFMATYALQSGLGQGIGFNTVPGYTAAKPFMEYMGWTTNYAGARFTTTNPEPVITPPTPEADMPIIAIEQNQSPNHPSHLLIGVGGVGRGWVDIPPHNRDYYNILRSVLNHAARNTNPDAKNVLPAQPTSVDLGGWTVTRDAYLPTQQTVKVDTKTVTDEILAGLRTGLPILGINVEEFAVAVGRHLTPHLARIPTTTNT